jgi:hypothetical protein
VGEGVWYNSAASEAKVMQKYDAIEAILDDYVVRVLPFMYSRHYHLIPAKGGLGYAYLPEQQQVERQYPLRKR